MNSTSGYLLFALPSLAFGVVALIIYRHFTGENLEPWMVCPAALLGFVLFAILFTIGSILWSLGCFICVRIEERKAKSQKQ